MRFYSVFIFQSISNKPIHKQTVFVRYTGGFISLQNLKIHDITDVHVVQVYNICYFILCSFQCGLQQQVCCFDEGRDDWSREGGRMLCPGTEHSGSVNLRYLIHRTCPCPDYVNNITCTVIGNHYYEVVYEAKTNVEFVPKICKMQHSYQFKYNFLILISIAMKLINLCFNWKTCLLLHNMHIYYLQSLI